MSVPIYLKKRNVSTFKATPGSQPGKVRNHNFVFAGSIVTADKHCLLSAF